MSGGSLAAALMRSRRKCSHVVSPRAIRPHWKSRSDTLRSPSTLDMPTQPTEPSPESTGTGPRGVGLVYTPRATKTPKEQIRVA